MERTLVIFKPDAVGRGVVGELISRFEKVGLKLVGMKMLKPDSDHFHHHYEVIGTMITRHGQAVYDATVAYVMSGPVIVMVLEGVEAAAYVRKMVGKTEPKGAEAGTIRSDYAHMNYAHADGLGIAIMNLVHASGDAAEAKAEIAHWFSDSELFEYTTAHEQFTQPRSK